MHFLYIIYVNHFHSNIFFQVLVIKSQFRKTLYIVRYGKNTAAR